MKDKEYEITSNLFGGYNKKKAREYIGELERLLKESQDELSKVQGQHVKLVEKLTEAESCYRALWERSRLLEETTNRQQELLEEYAKKEAASKEPIPAPQPAPSPVQKRRQKPPFPRKLLAEKMGRYINIKKRDGGI